MHDARLKSHHTRTACRSCAGETLRPFLSLGPTPLANSFLKSEAEFEAEVSYPLDLYFCEECSLVQLADVIDPEVLFRNYIYVTGTAGTIRTHNRDYARTVADFLGLKPEDLVIEVASNNGNLLKCFQDLGVKVLGVEPAENIAKMANTDGIETITRFFNAAAARDLRESYGPARAVIGNNVLAHVDDPVDFLAGCRTLIAEDGLVIIEVPYLEEFVELGEFDTVYHEHLCYFSITSLMRLCEAAGLSIVRVQRVPIHGGSIRMYAGMREAYPDHAPDVKAMSEDERVKGLTRFSSFEQFAEKARDTRSRLRSMLEGLRSEGKTIAAYGAPAKGNTLLNYCGIGRSLLDFAVDKNPLKVGLFTPGTHIPILPVSAVVDKQPDYLLILAWNFADEIIEQQSEFQARGGRFIVPIPEPRIVE